MRKVEAPRGGLTLSVQFTPSVTPTAIRLL